MSGAVGCQLTLRLNDGAPISTDYLPDKRKTAIKVTTDDTVTSAWLRLSLPGETLADLEYAHPTHLWGYCSPGTVMKTFAPKLDGHNLAATFGKR